MKTMSRSDASSSSVSVAACWAVEASRWASGPSWAVHGSAARGRE